MSGSLYALGPGDERTPVTGVSEIEPVLNTESVEGALFWPRSTSELVPPRRWMPETAAERRQRLALERVRTSAIAAWNAQR